MKDQIRACHVINLPRVAEMKEMLNNESLVISQLTEMYGNFTGDWGQVIAKTQAQLRRNIPLASPGSEITACRIYLAIWTFLPPVIMILGTIGNLLSFFVLCRRSMIQVSSYLYLAVLALLDEGVLITGLMKRWIEMILGYRAEDLNSAVCKLVQLAGVATSWSSVWIIVALTVERVIVISFPLQASRLATPSRARMVIGGIVIICILTNFHFFETVDLVRLPSPGRSLNSSQGQLGIYTCQYKPQYAGLTRLDAAVYSYLPFAIISLLNIIIVRGVYLASRNRAGLIGRTTSRKSRSGGDSSSSSENTRQLTIMLLVISFVFLLFTTPIVAVKFFALSNSEDDGGHSGGRTYTQANLQLVDCIAEMLMYCNHALNFLLYCTMGNKFRQQLRSLLCPGRHHPGPGARGMGESTMDYVSVKRNNPGPGSRNVEMVEMPTSNGSHR